MQESDQFDSDTFEVDENPDLTQVRSWGKAQDKARKAAEKAAEQATERAKKLSLRVAEGTFKEAGLSPKMATLFFTSNPDFDPEKFTKDEALAFAKEFDVVPQTTEESTTTESNEEASTEGNNSEESQEQTTEETEQETTTQPTGVKPLGGSKPPPNAVPTSEIWAAATRNDMAKVREIVAREAKTPGYIKYSHPDHVEDIE